MLAGYLVLIAAVVIALIAVIVAILSMGQPGVVGPTGATGTPGIATPANYVRVAVATPIDLGKTYSGKMYITKLPNDLTFTGANTSSGDSFIITNTGNTNVKIVMEKFTPSIADIILLPNYQAWVFVSKGPSATILLNELTMA